MIRLKHLRERRRMMQGWGRLPGRDQVRGQNHTDTGYGVKKVAAQKKITCNDQDLS